MYLHWTNHILDVNYKCYLYDFPREIFARISIFQPIFAIFGIFQRRHRVCRMGAHTFEPLSTLQGMSVLHFGGFVIAVSPLQAFTRLHENWWSSQNSSFQPTNETNFLQKFPFFSIYFICGLIIGYSQIWWYDIFRYMQDMEKKFFLLYTI